ncbi:STAS domain-containing protein [Mycobacterium sp.]|uniref:STAS domain-containing protein n=1 Tax=Mycobacterium sp. TaxID=1785 RepID=UPI003D6C31DA
MTELQFRLTVGTPDQLPVVTAVGDIDRTNADDFKDALAQAANGASAIIVDMTAVPYCDSSAVQALFTVARATEVHLVVPTTGPIRTLLRISGLDQIVTVST